MKVSHHKVIEGYLEKNSSKGFSRRPEQEHHLWYHDV